MWKVGEQVNAVTNTSFVLKTNTLKVVTSNSKWTMCKIKGRKDEATFPFFTEELERISNNPIIRVKRFLCRAFEC